MEKSDNVSKTFRGKSHVSAKIKNLKNVPNYFWNNSEKDDLARVISLSEQLDKSIREDFNEKYDNDIAKNFANQMCMLIDERIMNDIASSTNNDITNTKVITDNNQINTLQQLGNTATTNVEPVFTQTIAIDGKISSGIGVYMNGSLTSKQSEPITEDVINHPNHYNSVIFKQVIDMMIKLFPIEEVLAFCKLNSFKYRMRAGAKDATKIEQDINKAIWYENKFIILSQSEPNVKQILKG